MSFYFNFTTKVKNVDRILADQNGPESVKDFIKTALTGMPPDQIVQIHANGHLKQAFVESSPSNAEIRINLIFVTEPPDEGTLPSGSAA